MLDEDFDMISTEATADHFEGGFEDIANGTHSPMVLPGLRQEEVFRLVQDEQGNVVVTSADESPALMTGSELYRRFFGIEHLEPRALDRKLFEYATLAGYAGRTVKEDEKVRRLLGELKSAGIDPGFEPAPRKVAKTKQAAAREIPAAPRRRRGA